MTFGTTLILQGILESADHIKGNDEIIKEAANPLFYRLLCTDITISHKKLTNAYLCYYTTWFIEQHVLYYVAVT